jgi:hypothetical protein
MISAFALSCNENCVEVPIGEKSERQVIYVMHTSYGDEPNSRSDTLDGFPEHDPLDEFIGTSTFTSNDRTHSVNGYTNIDHVIDGDSFNIELDSLGVIYSQSLNWGGYSIIWTNNDSLNFLIAMALGASNRIGHDGIQDNLRRDRAHRIEEATKLLPPQ